MADTQDTNRVTEDQKATLAKRRGQAATQIADPEEKRKFIAAEGEAESKDKMKPGDESTNLPAMKYKNLSTESALKGYKKGTDRVASTGPAILHKDEAVLKKSDADKYRSAKSSAIYDLAKGNMVNDHDADDKPPKEIKHIVTRKAKGKDGKTTYIHEHHHTRPEHHPMEEHVSNGQDEMVGHMMEHMGEPNPGEAEADAGQSGIE